MILVFTKAADYLKRDKNVRQIEKRLDLLITTLNTLKFPFHDCNWSVRKEMQFFCQHCRQQAEMSI